MLLMDLKGFLSTYGVIMYMAFLTYLVSIYLSIYLTIIFKTNITVYLSLHYINIGVPGGVKIALSKVDNPSDFICTPNTINREVSSQEIQQIRQLIVDKIPLLNGELLDSTTCIYTSTQDGHFLIDFLPSIYLSIYYIFILSIYLLYNYIIDLSICLFLDIIY